MKEYITLKRQSLYTLVWSEPNTKLAARLKIRYTDLTAACQKMNIPRPGNVYWGRMQRGLSANKLDLPEEYKTDSVEVAILSKKPKKQRSKKVTDSQAESEPASEDLGQDPPKTLQGCHRIVSLTKKEMEARGPDYEGFMNSFSGGTLSVSVHKASQRRALLICEDIIRKCIKADIKFTETEEHGNFLFDFDEDSFGFEIKESRRRFEKPLEPGKYNWDKYYYEPTGKLHIKVGAAEYIDGLRSKWGDGNIQKLEDVLDQFVENLPVIAEYRKQRRLEREAEHRRYEYQDAQRDILIRRINDEAALRSELEEMAQDWRRATDIHSFLDHVENQRMDVSSEQKLSWISWGRSYAKRIDPLKNGMVDEAVVREGHDPDLDVDINPYSVRFEYPEELKPGQGDR